jgi:predicted ATP-grasp superfamily ATP-dependent carboligase
LRIFVFEYLTAGGWREISASASAIAEGRMMLEAVLGDLRDIDGVDAVVALDPAIDIAPVRASVATIAPDDPGGSWAAIAARSDLVWPIAPETAGILERVVEGAWRAGTAVLASGMRALRVARSKTATSAWLGARGIPVVATAPLATPPPAAAGWVVKPDDGAGAAATRFVADRAAVRRAAAAAPQALVAQPFLRGEALSLSLLVEEGEAWLLACNRQKVMLADGVFAYRGSLVGGAESRRAALEPLAQRIAAALPDLWGYVGVDLIDGADGPVVLEINPRLTTSYVGLAESIGVNPAALVLALRERPLRSLIRPLAARPVLVEVPPA